MTTDESPKCWSDHRQRMKKSNAMFKIQNRKMIAMFREQIPTDPALGQPPTLSEEDFDE